MERVSVKETLGCGRKEGRKEGYAGAAQDDASELLQPATFPISA